MTPKPCLFTRPSRIGTHSLCVVFRAADNHAHPYPAFWTSEERTAEIFISLGQSFLQEMSGLLLARNFEKLDNLFQEIEHATHKKRSAETDADDAKHSFDPNL